jgi:glycogen debranching enzyme
MTGKATPVMAPAPGERLVRFVGDRLRFEIRDGAGTPAPGWRARLRTNLCRADVLQREIIDAHAKGAAPAGAAWCDIPMQLGPHGWFLELPLADVGFFKAKAYLLDPRGWQHWPDGSDFGVSVHPDWTRTANTLYCAFIRLFGKTKSAHATEDPEREAQLKNLDAQGYAVIPPSGKLRDLVAQLPHIVDSLGCRIVHLLPVGPTPTTYARFGRYGSPYACLDLTAIDPALVVFDKRTTGVEQFHELAAATHRHGARLFLDIVINHTGWGSTLQENAPQWFLRKPGAVFHSPGAWGTTWEDLVELKQDSVALWDAIADSLLVWCRRGVDGFRCDAGYMVPMRAWQYIIARVRRVFPDVVFLLEGLGGAWETTEVLVCDGGMQWAYSELFQNYSAVQISGYLEHALKQSGRVGKLVHYSETHDNERLAGKGRPWSLLRNRLCALASSGGGFGFTCGAEWLATEKIKVHGCTALNWGAKDNLVSELARLNRLLADHPCFFDGAQLTRLSAPDSSVFALLRESAEGKDAVLVLVNLDTNHPRALTLKHSAFARVGIGSLQTAIDLLGQPVPEMATNAGEFTCKLAPAGAFCLAATARPSGLSGDAYRAARARAAWAVQALSRVVPPEQIDGFDWRELADQVQRSPRDFLVAASHRAKGLSAPDTLGFPNVIAWTRADARRITLVPANHWLLIEDDTPFTLALEAANCESETRLQPHVSSIPAAGIHIACLPPRFEAADATLHLERCTDHDPRISAEVRFLAATPPPGSCHPQAADLVLLTNGCGAMARLCVDLGRVNSKYDCVLGANLHPSLPVDRHVFAKRLRLWVNADGFISPLDFSSLASFTPGPPAVWQFIAQAGDARTVELQLAATMLPGSNTTVFCFSRPAAHEAHGRQLPSEADVRLTVRLDIEDRSFHSQTKHNEGAQHHFTTHCHPLRLRASGVVHGFAFTPARDRQLRAYATAGEFHPQAEWSFNIPHPVEATRGQEGAGDAFSPGWFEVPLAKGARIDLIVTAEANDPSEAALKECRARAHELIPAGGGARLHTPSGVPEQSPPLPENQEQGGGVPVEDAFSSRLRDAAHAYVVRRGEGKTVVAGYPWFLDWGRDTLICARGLLAAGMVEEVREILFTFARFEEKGTLPNIIHGEHIGNRDTSDAPLWFGVVCEELALNGTVGAGAAAEGVYSDGPRTQDVGARIYATPVANGGRTLGEVLRSLAAGYLTGTPNGIRVEVASGLVFSPSHFTWMDTNYPAGTPREGYPIEIQCLWIRLLRQLERIGAKPLTEPWFVLANRAQGSLEKLFWLEEQGWLADCLRAGPGTTAAKAQVDDALRSNCLFAVSLGLVTGERARRTVEAARRWLVIPGGLRSLAPLPVKLALEIRHHNHRLNDPHHPYWGRYEGDEDTRRKPAYHNGTAWTWTFPVFCEALAAAWAFSPEAVAAARAYLGTSARLMHEGCLGQIPEILDGDAPHTQRGCDAQAWGVTEALRVWRSLGAPARQLQVASHELV